MALFSANYPSLWELQSPTRVTGPTTGDLDYNSCLLQAGSSLGLFLFTFYQILTQHFQVTRSWNLARLVAVLLQLMFIGNFITAAVFHLPEEKLSDDKFLRLAVRTSTILATTASTTSLCLGLPSTGRGLYHLVMCLMWPSISSTIDLNAVGRWVGNDTFLGTFVAAVLVDAFYQGPTEPGQQHLSRDELPVLQNMTFDWLNPIFRNQEAPGLDDLTEEKLPSEFSSYEQRFCDTCSSAAASRSSSPLIRFILREHRGQLVRASLLRLVDDASKFCIPWLLRGFLTEVSARSLAQLFVIRIVGTLCGNYSGLALRETSAQYRAMLSSALHAKALRLGHHAPSAAEPDLPTLSGVDSLRLSQSVLTILDVWSFPLQGVLSLGGVLYLLSWKGALAAILATILTFPLLGFVNKRDAFWIQSNMAAKGRRSALTAEMLNDIKTIKLHAWESTFNEKLAAARQQDLKTTARQAILKAIMVGITQMIPSIMTLASFGLAVWKDDTIDSQLIFTCILLFSQLSSSAISLSEIPPQLRTMSTSMGQIMRYLSIDETEQSGPLLEEVKLGPQDQILSVGPAKLSWPGHQPIISSGTLSIRRGTLTVVRGQTASGKSTFFSSLLPHVKKSHSVAYLPQDPVLIAGTIRDNILLGKPFDFERYQVALHSCGLASELSSFSNGDMTVLGGSSSASKGQMARIGLARVVYAGAEVNILDDPLSALGINFHRTIVKRLFGINGILRKSTNIVVSSSRFLTTEADSIISLRAGTIVQEAGDLIFLAKNVSSSSSQNRTATGSNSVGNFSATPKTPVIGIPRISPNLVDVQGSGGAAAIQGLLAGMVELQDAEDTDLRHGRSSAKPKPKRRPLRKFLDYSGIWGWCGAVALLLMGRLSSVESLVVLKDLAMNRGSAAADLGIYGLFSILQVVFFLLFVVLLYRWAVVPGQRKFHANLVSAVLSQGLEYFEQRNTRDILSIFTEYLTRVDVGMISSIITLVGQYTNLLTSASVLTSNAPTSLAFVVPLMGMCYYAKRLYLGKLKELQHLDAQARAPMLGLLQQAEHGRVMLSANDYTTHQLEQFTRLTENSMRTFFNMSCLEPWLTVRLDACSVALQVFAGISLLASSADTGTIGFVMTYVFQITAILNVIARFTPELETNLESFSKILDCIEGNEDGAGVEGWVDRPQLRECSPGQRFIPPPIWP